jgi:hypothetical protein
MLKDVKAVLAKYWGHEDFLPLQQQAIESASRQGLASSYADRRGEVSLFPGPPVLLPA